ncbi:hypothetical protein D9M68_908150 [compost metagenome]
MDTTSLYLEKREAWLLWLVYEVQLDTLEYGIGADADEVAFVDPEQFKDSTYRSEQLIYKFATDRQLTASR